MIRKLLVRIIAFLFMAQGLWDIVAFFSPIFTSPKHVTLNLFVILMGALGFWAGVYLFRLEEYGRKFTIVLLFLRIIYNLFYIVWALSQKGLSFAINYFDKPLVESISAYVFAISLMVWAGIALGVILFLRQRETKTIFMSETSSENGSEPMAKSLSDR